MNVIWEHINTTYLNVSLGDKIKMNYKILEKEAFKIVGKGIKVSTVNNEHQRAITEFWSDSNKNGFASELSKSSGPMGHLGVCMQFEPDYNGFLYFIGAEKNIDVLPDGWEEKQIPAATWAVFECVGPMPDAIQKVWEQIYSEWFPSTNYKHANAPEIEVYPVGDSTHENYRSEIWIPIMDENTN